MTEKRLIYGQNELATYLRVAPGTVNRWHREGKFAGCYNRIGRKIIYSLDKIDAKFNR